jgi:hypothetical protein
MFLQIQENPLSGKILQKRVFNRIQDIPRPKLGLVSVGGVLVKADAKLADRDCVRVFQPMAGG